jgi:hypothetical protein
VRRQTHGWVVVDERRRRTEHTFKVSSGAVDGGVAVEVVLSHRRERTYRPPSRATNRALRTSVCQQFIRVDVRLGAYNELHLIALGGPWITKIAMSAFLDPVIRRDAEQAGARFNRETDGLCVHLSAVPTDSTARAKPRAIRARADFKLMPTPPGTSCKWLVWVA